MTAKKYIAILTRCVERHFGVISTHDVKLTIKCPDNSLCSFSQEKFLIDSYYGYVVMIIRRMKTVKIKYRVFIKYCDFILNFCDSSELCQFCCSAGVLPAWCVYTH